MCKINNNSDKHISFGQGINNIYDVVTVWARKLWYVILISTSTPYVICHFDEITDFQFFNQFNGKNLIFVVWIVLLIIPLFDSFEGFGISIKRFNKQKEDKQLDALADNEKVPTQEELENLLKNDSK